MNILFEELLESENRYDNILHMTANENVMSDVAWKYYSSRALAQRYRMGSGTEDVYVHSNFAAKGMPEVDRVITEAEEAAKRMLHAGAVNLNLLSGVHAMLSSVLCVSNPGDTVMSVFSRQGGHFCTKGILEMTGRKHLFTEYDFENYTFNVDKLAKQFHAANAKVLYLYTSVLIRPHPIRELREKLGEEAIIIYDASHTIGLIMSGRFQSPLEEGADVISANTHKTLPGPHHGMIAFKDAEKGQVANKLMDGNMYSSTHINEVLALSVTILELEKYGKCFSDQMVKNANYLAKCLEKNGCEVRKMKDGVYTYDHQIHMYTEMANRDIVQRFLDNGISINTSKALGERLFVRIGLQEVTRRGMKESEMEVLASFFKDILEGKNVLEEVKAFNRQFRDVQYGFTLEKNE